MCAANVSASHRATRRAARIALTRALSEFQKVGKKATLKANLRLTKGAVKEKLVKSAKAVTRILMQTTRTLEGNHCKPKGTAPDPKNICPTKNVDDVTSVATTFMDREICRRERLV